jgi:preprotein translocase subunit SecD
VARSGPTSRPGRAIGILVALLAVTFGSIGAGVIWSDAAWTPKLALDLEGGTQMILTPVPQSGSGKQVTPDQVAEAVNIIRQRVNGSGVSEAEVNTQGARNIVVALPGSPDEKTRNLVKQSAELTFRPVLVEEPTNVQPTPAPSATPSASPSGKSSGKSSGTSTASPSSKPKAGASSSSAGRVLPQALTRDSRALPAASSAAAPGATASGAGAGSGDGATGDGTTAAAADPAKGTASDLSQITQKIGEQFTAETCEDLEKVQSGADDPTKPLVTCDTDRPAKYILGPVEVRGKNIKSATAGLGQNSQGFATGEWEVRLSFDSTGAKQFASVTERLAALTGAQNQFAIVLDGLVVSAPTTRERIGGGNAQITGNFTQDSATTLANQLRFGALPVSFRVETEEQISALLGGEQLRRGLLAGLIGLILVVIYSLLQYRLLGLVTVFSLLMAASFTYGAVVLLGWTQGFRLSLPGVAGLIVAIGITADSFIVYFERIRDEAREGRPLRTAVEAAWIRARRTILASDTVSFLAAVVLYVLAVGGVRGFAFTLGLTTLVDVLVVFTFTKPVVTLLARTEFFGKGHRFSGFSAEQLGRPSPAYQGRGRVRPAGQSIAARRAAAAGESAGRSEGGTGAGTAPKPEPGDPAAEPPSSGSGPGERAAAGGRRPSGGRES